MKGISAPVSGGLWRPPAWLSLNVFMDVTYELMSCCGFSLTASKILTAFLKIHLEVPLQPIGS